MRNPLTALIDSILTIYDGNTTELVDINQTVAELSETADLDQAATDRAQIASDEPVGKQVI